MSTQKVPLVAYENGERKIIGEAVVDINEDGSLDVTGQIKDPTYLKSDFLKGLSLGPFTGKIPKE